MIDLRVLSVGDKVMVVPEWPTDVEHYLGTNMYMDRLRGHTVTITRIDIDERNPDHSICDIAEDDGQWIWAGWMFDYIHNDGLDEVDVAIEDFSTVLVGRS